MKFKFSFLATLSVLAITYSTPSKADVFVWEDAQTHISFSYPDRWRQRNNQRTDDVYTVAGPGMNDHAQCRLRVREDKRFATYPQRFSAAIQHDNYSRDFWDAYLGEYDTVAVDIFHDDAGLGRGFGSYAMASYTTAIGPRVDKTALMAVSIYNNKAYITECSAEKHAYSKWHNSFLSVLKSVDIRKTGHELVTGNYRDFLQGDVKIQGARDIDVSYY